MFSLHQTAVSGTRSPRPIAGADDDTELVVHRSSRAHKPCVSDTYFDTMSRMQAAVSNRDYEGAARLVCENLQYIPDWVKETRPRLRVL